MELTKALALPQTKGVTAIVGGGGKTSLMYRLGAEYAKMQYPVIVTTTTRIGDPAPTEARLIERDSPAAKGALASPGEVICVGKRGEEGKLYYPGEALWARCVLESSRVFCESDGARMLPIKVPAGHEPCIAAPEIDTVIAVTGLTALGRPLNEICFRCDLACRLFDVTPETRLTPELLAKLLTSQDGQFKNVNHVERFRIFINQADNPHLAELGLATAKLAKKNLPGCRIVIGTLRPAAAVRKIL